MEFWVSGTGTEGYVLKEIPTTEVIDHSAWGRVVMMATWVGKGMLRRRIEEGEEVGRAGRRRTFRGDMLAARTEAQSLLRTDT